MVPVGLLDDLSPHARVATAVAPFVVAIVLRFIAGRTRLTNALLSLSTIWFAINVLVAPYSARMQQDIQNVRGLFR